MADYEKIGLNELIPSDYNPRIMSNSQQLKLAKNLERFGLVDPIIINLKNNHIVGGHQRYNILFEKYSNTSEGAVHPLNLIRLGDIGWVFEDTELKINDDNHEKALNLSLNRLDGEFDDKLAGKLISELTEAHYDMELTGFEDYEIIEYTLDDFDLELANNQILLDDDTDKTEETNITGQNYSSTLSFNTQKERQQFIQWIGNLKQEYPDKTISQAITKYIREHIVNDNEKVEQYIILHESPEEKNEFETLLNELENNKRYKNNPIMNLIQDEI